MVRQQVNVRLSSYTVAQLKDLASRFDMSESTVIMLAIDRLVRDTLQGRDIRAEKNEEQTQQEKGEQSYGSDKATRTRRRYDHKAPRRKMGVQD